VSFKYREIAEILKVIDASDCEELVLETDGVRLVVRKGETTRVDELVGAATTPSPLPQGTREQSTGDIKATSREVGNAEVDRKINLRADGCIEVRAPMVGTFYRAPSPTEPAFVNVGEKVRAGESLYVIEVMKLFTTMEATVSGWVKEVAVKDEELVEYGQVLFVIEPEVIEPETGS